MSILEINEAVAGMRGDARTKQMFMMLVPTHRLFPFDTGDKTEDNYMLTKAYKNFAYEMKP